VPSETEVAISFRAVRKKYLSKTDKYHRNYAFLLGNVLNEFSLVVTLTCSDLDLLTSDLLSCSVLCLSQI